MTRKVLFGVLCCALFLTIAAQSDKSYRADRFDVVVDVQPDRSLLVEENVTFRFTGGPFSFVFRELPTDHTDGITSIIGGADGVPWPRGTGPGEVEISGTNPIEVVWHLSPTSDTVQTFNLSYQPLGVVRREDEADVLNWQALPDEYDYHIDSSRLMINYPPGGRLQEEPEATAGQALITAGPESAVFDLQNLSPGDPLVARLSFAPGAFTAAPPLWQAQQDAQNGRAWIWIVTAGAILAAGIFALFRAARPYSRSIPETTSYLHKPPADLPPALAGFLSNSTVAWPHGLATLFDLAGRGYIVIEQISEKTLFRSAEFTVTLQDRPQGLRPHEQALVDLLFTDKSGIEQDVVTLAEMGHLITSSRWKEFTDTLKDEAGSEGYTDPAVEHQKRRVIGWGGALILVGFASMVAIFLLRDTFGAWPLISAGAVVLVGILGMIIGASLSPLSEKGFQFATAYEPFRRFLKDVSKGKMELPDKAYYEAYLPYATAYGLAEPWVKGQSKSDYQQIPSYFRAVEAGGGEMAAFVAVISAASHSGGAASASAGAAGAGAAGGGASGAG